MKIHGLELKIGTTYCSTNSYGDRFIWDLIDDKNWNGIEDSTGFLSGNSVISISTSTYLLLDPRLYPGHLVTIKEASEDEIAWLKYCTDENRFIPFIEIAPLLPGKSDTKIKQMPSQTRSTTLVDLEDIRDRIKNKVKTYEDFLSDISARGIDDQELVTHLLNGILSAKKDILNYEVFIESLKS